MTWEYLLRTVPRDAFLPDTVWVHRGGPYMMPLKRVDDPQRWRELCDADEAVVTQVDDGVHERGVFPTSSSSAPSIMAFMLETLDAGPGMRVLEIGTGTGYNAAVLAEGVGAENVVTMEMDETIAEHAHMALKHAGYPVSVVTGDGTFGYPDGAPYDRMIVTAAATEIPHAWADQLRRGGKLLVPWASALQPAGPLLTLTAVDDGIAEGRFHDEAAFMCLRGQRIVLGSGGLDDSNRVDTATCLYPRELFDEDFDAEFAVGLQLPGCRHAQLVEDGDQVLRLSHPDSGSWASYAVGGDEHQVYQVGPRWLWDEFEAAYRWWVDAGRPDHTRFGMIIGPDGQQLWLDSPGNPVGPVQSGR